MDTWVFFKVRPSLSAVKRWTVAAVDGAERVVAWTERSKVCRVALPTAMGRREAPCARDLGKGMKMTVWLDDEKVSVKRPLRSARSGAVLIWLMVSFGGHWTLGCVPDAVPRARARLKAGDIAGAERIVRAGLERHGGNLDLWVLRLRIDLIEGKRADAVEVLHRIETLATRREWKRVRKMVFAHTIWEALGDDRARTLGLDEARRYRFSTLRARLDAILTKGEPAQRAAAAGALLHTNPDAERVLAQLAASRDDGVRLAVAHGLSAPWSAELWQLVVRLSHDPNPEVRGAVLESLAASMAGSRKPGKWMQEILALLLANLRDPSGPVRAAAARALKKLAPQRLSRLAAADPELAVRLAAVRAGRRDRGFLLAQAHSDRPFVALRAAVMLWKSGVMGGDDVVSRWMADGQWQVRAAACNAAVVMKGSKKACKAVEQALGDRDRRVRAAACGAGLHLGCDESRTLAVCRGLASGTALPAAAAAWDLARRGRSWGLGRLEVLARHPGPGRLSAMRSLAMLKKGLPALMSCWRTGPWRCRMAAARLLYENFRQPSVP